MFGLDFLPPHFLATSSGSVSLNSPLVPSQVMIAELVASESNSSKNCQSWICPEPWETKPRDVDDKRAYGSVVGKMSTYMVNGLILEWLFHPLISLTLTSSLHWCQHHTNWSPRVLGISKFDTFFWNYSGQLSNHHKKGNQWWVQIYWTWWSPQKVGRE